MPNPKGGLEWRSGGKSPSPAKGNSHRAQKLAGLFAALLLFCTIAISANAATRCVIHFSNCTGYTYNGLNWTTTCDGRVIKGKAICSSTPNGPWGSVVLNVSSSSGKYCWCQMTSFDGVAVSSVRFVDSGDQFYDSASSCTNNGCASYCASEAENIQFFTSLVSALN
jgi:hypothetical protein